MDVAGDSVAGSTRSSQYRIITKLAFGDDGSGMPEDILHQCLQLGYSSRFNDRTGIGRFGVGMTLGAIHECQRVEVYSKQLGGKWNYTHIDIDEIANSSDSSINRPTEKSPPKEFMSLVNDKSGTLVVWSKYDRQPESALGMMKKLGDWIGRTFRYFIWGGVNISINNESVFAVDPLYVNTEKTRFPNDPVALEYPPMTIEWPIPAIDKQDGLQDGENHSVVTIRMSFLPEEWRKMQGTGGGSKAKDRFVHENEGISIMRNGREVFYGQIPYWPKAQWWKEIDRWWGCEISN
jgi:hypothetical protein